MAEDQDLNDDPENPETPEGAEGAGAAPVAASNGSDEAVYGIPVKVSTVLGNATIRVSKLLELRRGAIVELDRKVGEAIDIYVNNRLVARGEVIVIEDRLGVTITEVISSAYN